MKNKSNTIKERPNYFELVDKKASENNTIDLNAYAIGVEEGVKWIEQKMYSEEQVCEFIEWLNLHYRDLEHTKILNDARDTKQLIRKFTNK